MCLAPFVFTCVFLYLDECGLSPERRPSQATRLQEELQRLLGKPAVQQPQPDPAGHAQRSPSYSRGEPTSSSTVCVCLCVLA